jgi:hypothetical protein
VVISVSHALKMTLLTGLSTGIGENKIRQKFNGLRMISKNIKSGVGVQLTATNEAHGACLVCGWNSMSDGHSKLT